MGNPIYDGKKEVDTNFTGLCEAQLAVLARLPNMERIDGKTVTLDDRNKLNS